MSYVVVIDDKKFTVKNSGHDTEKMWSDLIKAAQLLNLKDEAESLAFYESNDQQLAFDGEVSPLLDYVKGDGIITSWYKKD